MNSHLQMFGLFGLLLAWSFYRRVRRNIGRQPVRPGRLLAYAVLLGALSLFFALTGLAQPRLLEGLFAGLALGALLALLGLRLTQFETTARGSFYTPNTHIGVILMVIFIGRLVYRLMLVSEFSESAPGQRADLGQSPLTNFVYGLLAGYYILYNLRVLARSKKAGADDGSARPNA